ncbi:gamma-glutamyltranspeptidase [Thalassobaculum fulvum]|uniref:Gamma-glutamyltranspeptidase n=1 Tax=Thalassobaculum fulvum TaxID=1633335 RepID=A0A918XQT0_9PROT|nr:gamma-glutamyltransferase [Thalassobaculum fulvum]GHD45478.1 gamma-glutamyltranspeptidase [Thalassobaculum fulvum]
MPAHQSRPSVRSVKGMVAAAHPLAAAAGAAMLDSGGNAFDAIVATAAALNVTEPFMSGMLGLGLATFYPASEGRVRALDFHPPVPRRFPTDSIAKEATVDGPLAGGTPGNLAGWATLNKTYGRKSLAECFAPAITLARDGFPISPFYLDIIAVCANRKMSDGWAPIFAFDGAPKVGMILRQPELADTLATIAADGPGALYGGALGKRVVDELAKMGGCIGMDDLEAVEPVWEDPIVAEFRGLSVHVPPPPAESFQFLTTLRLLAETDFSGLPHLGEEHLDRVFRAIRIAAELRIRRNKAPVADIEALLSEATLAPLRARLTDGSPVWGRTEQHGDGPLATGPSLKEHTTSFSAMDTDGNAVCITQSLGSPFGSGTVIPGTGLCLNNFMNWGDLSPESPNFLKPGERFAMCLAPSVSTVDGKPVLCLGTPGSYGIPQTQSQAMVHLLGYGLDLQAAIDAPRGRLWDGTRVMLENRVPADVVEKLRARGHGVEVVGPVSWSAGGMHAVSRDPETGAFAGAADARRDGAAVAATR